MFSKNLYFKSTVIIILSVASVLFFQNCGDVKIRQNQSLAVPENFSIKSTICSDFSASSSVSKYTVVDFFAINLTISRHNGKFIVDSNLNGVMDSAEDAAAIRPAYPVTSLDSDDDGIPDFIEIAKGTNPFRNDANEDGVDNDSVENKKEIQLGTDPAFVDNGESYIISNLSKAKISSADCGLGQDTLDFTLAKLPLLEVASFSDQVNAGDWNLSHDKNENVIFIGYYAQPTNVTSSALKFFGKILKVRMDQSSPIVLKATDLKEM